MRRVLPLLVVLMGGFAPAPVYKPPAVDLRAMQGVWDFVARMSGGRPVDHIVATVTISGDRLTYMDAAGSFRRTWTLTLVADGFPRRFDSKLELPPPEAEALLGVYRISGDTLVMCYVNADSGVPRPAYLTAQQEWVYLDILKRRKP